MTDDLSAARDDAYGVRRPGQSALQASTESGPARAMAAADYERHYWATAVDLHAAAADVDRALAVAAVLAERIAEIVELHRRAVGGASPITRATDGSPMTVPDAARWHALLHEIRNNTDLTLPIRPNQES